MRQRAKYLAYISGHHAADYERMGWLIGQCHYDDGNGNYDFIGAWLCDCPLPLLKGERHERKRTAQEAAE